MKVIATGLKAWIATELKARIATELKARIANPRQRTKRPYFASSTKSNPRQQGKAKGEFKFSYFRLVFSLPMATICNRCPVATISKDKSPSLISY